MNKQLVSVVLVLVLAGIVSYAWLYPFLGVVFVWWKGLVVAAFWLLVGVTTGHILK